MKIDVRALVADSAAPRVMCHACRWLASRPADEAREWRAVMAEGAPLAQVARAMAKVDPKGAPSRGALGEHSRKAAAGVH